MSESPILRVVKVHTANLTSDPSYSVTEQNRLYIFSLI